MSTEPGCHKPPVIPNTFKTLIRHRSHDRRPFRRPPLDPRPLSFHLPLPFQPLEFVQRLFQSIANACIHLRVVGYQVSVCREHVATSANADPSVGAGSAVKPAVIDGNFGVKGSQSFGEGLGEQDLAAERGDGEFGKQGLGVAVGGVEDV